MPRTCPYENESSRKRATLNGIGYRLCYLNPARPSRHGGVWGGVLACLIVAGIFAVMGYRMMYVNPKDVAPKDLITQTVSRGSFDHIVLEEGEIESSRNTEIICEVKSRGTGGVAILWVIDEGTPVKEGDKLVELDTSELELREKEQRIQVITEEARVATATAKVEQANIAKEEYLQGIFETQKAALESEIQVALQNQTKAKLSLQASERLVAKGLIKDLQLQADRYALANASTQLKSAKGRLRVLEDLTKKKFLVKFNSDIEASKASLNAANSELLEEQNELDKIVGQIEKCLMLAPADGVVVHANKFSNRGGNAEFVVEAGSKVRERQTIIRLPDPSQMQIRCKVNESRITLVQEGMPTMISIDAIPGLSLTGRVTKVNRYAEPGSWFSSSIKEYAVFVEIVDPPEDIRTGMTAEAQIFVEQLDNTLQIPIEGLYEHGGEMYTLVRRGENEFQTIMVSMGATNNTMACIENGLNEHDEVVLNLRSHLSLMTLPKVLKEDNQEMRTMRDQYQQSESAKHDASPPDVNSLASSSKKHDSAKQKRKLASNNRSASVEPTQAK